MGDLSRTAEIQAQYAEAVAWVRIKAPEQTHPGWKDRWSGSSGRPWVKPDPHRDPGAIQLAADAVLDSPSIPDFPDEARFLERCSQAVLSLTSASWGRVRRQKDKDDVALNLPLAGAWARRRAQLPSAPGEEPMFKPVVGAVVVVVVAATAVVAYLAWSEAQRRRRPSPQLERIRALARTLGPAAEGARALAGGADAQMPSAWTLGYALERLGPRAEDPSLRACLASISGQPEFGIETLRVQPGTAFDPRTMIDASGIAGDERKRVREVVADGFRVATAGMIVRTRVLCVTEDWLALVGGEGPAAEWVRAHGDALVSEVEGLRLAWRAADGLREPGALRDAFRDDPGALTSWLDALMQRFQAIYAGCPDTPRIGPKVGDLYQPAQMRLAEGATLDRSVVTEVLSEGLATPTGYAILDAIVRVQPAADQEGLA